MSGFLVNLGPFFSGFDDGFHDRKRKPYASGYADQYSRGYDAGLSSRRQELVVRFKEGAQTTAKPTCGTAVFREVPKTTRRGRMSDDRVLFFLRAAHLQDYRYVDVLKATFGLTKENIDKLLDIASPRAGDGVDSHGVHIICRPSQFTRFLIRRSEAGKQNQFKELNPYLFDAKEIPSSSWDVDVSRNPA